MMTTHMGGATCMVRRSLLVCIGVCSFKHTLHSAESRLRHGTCSCSLVLCPLAHHAPNPPHHQHNTLLRKHARTSAHCACARCAPWPAASSLPTHPLLIN